jgi:glutathione S-transferase
MQLYHSPTSPYVRKVVVTAIELGIRDRIEVRPTNVWDPSCKVGEVNPLGRIPVLVGSDGEVLYDSPVICEYLDAVYGGGRLLAGGGAERWRTLRLQALGDGLLDAAVLRALELRRRPDNLRWSDLIERQRTVMGRALDDLEQKARSFRAEPDLGQIAVGCALGYIDLRFAEDEWRARRPGLRSWFERFSARPSFANSMPPAEPVVQGGVRVR